MVYEASRLRREKVDDEHLCVGVKCGYSDTTSGIAGNPAVGYLYDRIVAAGGTALFGETTEIIGAEQALARRAATPEVAEAILRAVTVQEDRRQGHRAGHPHREPGAVQHQGRDQLLGGEEPGRDPQGGD